MKKLQFLFGGLIIFWLGLTVFSCNTTGVTPTNYSRLRVVNALTGSSPFNFFLNNTLQTGGSITFPGASGYISVTPGTKYFQISLATTPGLYFDPGYITLNTDSSYSVFVTGQAGSYASILTRDTLTPPAIGKAKIRFVNASLYPAALDVTINAVKGYTNISYKSSGRFMEVPAGTYEFKAFTTGTTAPTLTTLSTQTLADGKIYTLYAAGQVGSMAANAAFGLNLITNLLPAIK